MTETDQTSPEFAAGSRFDGYTIERQIAEGGMARLYLAHDEAGKRRVLKVPRLTHDTDPVAVVAFENELRLARYLEDFPHAYMPVSRHAGADSYLVMDYIEGTDLWSHLREQGCLDEARTIALAKKIVRCLAELHRRRIVHLDMKLSNIMLTPDGDIRLVDFGLANHLDLPDHIYESFREPKGTPAYIAPEQFFGIRDEPRSDIFSIGTMLYEMATSKLPYPDAQSVLGVVSRIKREPVSPRTCRPELSEEFTAVVMTCLQNVPDRRFADMDELYAALDRIAPASAPSSEVPQGSKVASPRAAEPSILARITGHIQRLRRVIEGDRIDEIKAWIEEHQRQLPPTRYRIVVALDSEDGERIETINREILAQAIRQARLQPSIVTALTVLSEHNVGVATDERERIELNADYQKARQQIGKLIAASDHGGLPIGINLRSGNTVEAIGACVKDYEADLLVIGAQERGVLGRFVLGNTTYKVLTTVKCPMFVVQQATPKNRPPAAE